MGRSDHTLKPYSIDNDNLPIDGEEGGVKTLGSTAVKDKDYTVVGNSVWEMLKDIYGIVYVAVLLLPPPPLMLDVGCSRSCRWHYGLLRYYTRDE